MTSSPVIGTPDEKPKPPNGLIRRDSYHDVGSDSDTDEPFFNFDSEEMDDEELYCESLLEELKKQQVKDRSLFYNAEPSSLLLLSYKRGDDAKPVSIMSGTKTFF